MSSVKSKMPFGGYYASTPMFLPPVKSNLTSALVGPTTNCTHAFAAHQSEGGWVTVIDFLNGCYMFFGALSGLLNGICIYALIRGQMLRKSHAFVLVGVLCLSNFIEGCMAFLPTGFVRLFGLATISCITQLQCFFLSIPLLFAIPFTGFTMLLVAVERLYAVAFPFHYQRSGNKFIAGGIVGVVALSVFFALCGAIGMQPTRVVMRCVASSAVGRTYFLVWTNVTRIVPCVLCCVAYVAVAVLVRRHKTTVASLVSCFPGARVAVPQAALKPHPPASPHNLSKMLTIICLTYIGFSLTGNVFWSFVAPQMHSATARSAIAHIGGTLVVMNSAVNAMIFPLKDEEVRKAFKDCFCVDYFQRLRQKLSKISEKASSSKDDAEDKDSDFVTVVRF